MRGSDEEGSHGEVLPPSICRLPAMALLFMFGLLSTPFAHQLGSSSLWFHSCTPSNRLPSCAPPTPTLAFRWRWRLSPRWTGASPEWHVTRKSLSAHAADCRRCVVQKCCGGSRHAHSCRRSGASRGGQPHSRSIANSACITTSGRRSRPCGRGEATCSLPSCFATPIAVARAARGGPACPLPEAAEAAAAAPRGGVRCLLLRMKPRKEEPFSMAPSPPLARPVARASWRSSSALAAASSPSGKKREKVSAQGRLRLSMALRWLSGSTECSATASRKMMAE
mmetsp:Transcript_2546/g.9190  ORF Transcript_2546/g.9190 Transcript_2546/m.9190 type:complete len:281 (+) Transcript_2546:188-1030(+)